MWRSTILYKDPYETTSVMEKVRGFFFRGSTRTILPVIFVPALQKNRSEVSVAFEHQSFPRRHFV